MSRGAVRPRKAKNRDGDGAITKYLLKRKKDVEREKQEASWESRIAASSTINVRPCRCRRPKFRGQQVITEHGLYRLDGENVLMLIHDVLSVQKLEAYLNEAVLVKRASGRSGFGMKPRREICYSPDGRPYMYSRIAHPTVPYPPHVRVVMEEFSERVRDMLQRERFPANPYTVPTSAVDIIYDDTFPRGGSMGAHKDDEDEWGMVVVFSLGQTRYLRVRRDKDRAWYNVAASHNSLIVMYGPTFQSLYTHQVDKLYKDEEVGVRLSLNIRYKTSGKG